MENSKKISDFINGKVTYDKFGGQYLWINDPEGGCQMLAQMRGYGAIQNMFKTKGGMIDTDAANKFQDELGEFISEAINEKINKTIISGDKSKNKDFIIKEQSEQIDFLLKCMQDIKSSLSKFRSFPDSKEFGLINAALDYPKFSTEINDQIEHVRNKNGYK